MDTRYLSKTPPPDTNNLLATFLKASSPKSWQAAEPTRKISTQRMTPVTPPASRS